MKLRRDGWLGRAFFWALRSPWGLGGRSPGRAWDIEAGAPVTLCEVCWKVFVFIPIRWAFSAAAIVGVGFVVLVGLVGLARTVDQWLMGALIVAAMFSAAALAFLAGYWLKRRQRFVDAGRNAREVGGAAVAYLVAVKRRYCPIIEWTDDE